MSALALKADIHRGYGNACHVPQAGFMRCSKKKALFDHLVGARRAFETGLRRACFDLSDGGALGFTLRSSARVQLDLILLPHDSREMDRSTNRFHRSGCRLYLAHMKEAGDAPASSLVILLRIRTGSCLLPCDGRHLVSGSSPERASYLRRDRDRRS